jgi:Patatin-like phospholipase
MASSDDRTPSHPERAAASRPEPPLAYRRLSLAEHFEAGRPKRILAIDGGGIRGALAIGLLEKVEAILRARHGGDERFRLCDYFDLIGGTSTGSIIATALALGHSAAEVGNFYFDLAPRVFAVPRNPLTSAFYSKFDGERLREILRSILGDETFGSSKLATGLAVIARRVNTASNWVVFNNPRGQFFDDVKGPGGTSRGNKSYLLRDVVRASTAAPYFFEPERIEIGEDEDGLFIDGGLTLHNNPSLQLLMLAALKGYRFDWPLGPENLFMLSIGTGDIREKMSVSAFHAKPNAARAAEALLSTIGTAGDLVETLMQWFSEPKAARAIDSEIGALAGELIGGQLLLSYQRYNVSLTHDWLERHLDLDLSAHRITEVRALDNAKAVPLAYEIGRRAAEAFVRADHFPPVFDLDMTQARA